MAFASKLLLRRVVRFSEPTLSFTDMAAAKEAGPTRSSFRFSRSAVGGGTRYSGLGTTVRNLLKAASILV